MNEPQLVRAALSLKFKFSQQLLATLVATSGAGPTTGRRNQSQSQSRPLAERLVGATNQQPADSTGPLGLVELLRVDCKYKLTEASEVTFNELVVAQQLARPSRQPAREAANRRSAATSGAWLGEPSPSLKLVGQQLLQANCPAGPGDLWRAIRGLRSRAACRLGALAMGPDEPLIVAGSSPLEQEFGLGAELELGERRRRRRQPGSAERHLEAPVGSVLRLNCSTIGALEQVAQVSDYNDDELSIGGAAAEDAADSAHRHWHQSHLATGYCNDTTLRRRSLISGRFQSTNEPEVGAPGPLNQRRPAATATMSKGRTAQVAYLSLGSPTPWPSGPPSRQTAADSSDDTSNRRRDLVAPPLLEWFINNQEVSCAACANNIR